MSDYKDTIFLPNTAFPMKGDLAKREPEWVKRWQDMNLYKKLRSMSQGREKFVLHAGPPYANGHFHIGHAFTGIFKDIVVRTQQMSGKDAPFVPGWDCHGLPIEWKIEEKYQKQKKAKDEVPVGQFRKECRDFAQHWIDVQREETRRMGILADLNHPYITMDYSAEASITGELFKFLKNGGLYKGYKPVMWSVVEKTAMAEAEIEYQDRQSPSIYVRFPIIETKSEAFKGVSIVIWTTTPWSLPGNRAVAYGPEVSYVTLVVEEIGEGSLARVSEKFLLSGELVEAFVSSTKITRYSLSQPVNPEDLKEIKIAHPFYGKGYDFLVPLLPGDHVTTDVGTGFVHTAPSHGLEDFEIGKKFNLEIPETVKDDGYFSEKVPIFAGHHVYKVNPLIIETLKESGNLVAESVITHSYPHSWRSKAPLIYRATPQWFIGLEKNKLREKSLEEIEKVSWFPSQSKNRIRAMVEQSPDWCVSRQRVWGVPLALFVEKSTGKPLIDDQVNERILKAFKEEGCDIWFEAGIEERFLTPNYNPKDYEPVRDILDVWFDSGSTFGFVLEDREDLAMPADLYLEGSDQHRGWFQKSLLVACGTRGIAPFKAVVTHGFVVDEQGRKMSKSLGNGVFPMEVADNMGVEILRLWTAFVDYRDDLRVGPEILKHLQDLYRRFRNTLRYLLGALSGYSAQEKVGYELLPDLEKWVLHRLQELDQLHKKSIEAYDYQGFYNQLHAFCAVDLSAFYFDIRKDSLYCDHPNDDKRKATRWVMYTLFHHLTHWLAPLLCFTTEEAWLTHDSSEESIHLRTFPKVLDSWKNVSLSERFEKLRLQRKCLTGALEEARAKGLIGSSLQAHLVVYDKNNNLLDGVDYSELGIVSTIERKLEEAPEGAYTTTDTPDLGVIVEVAKGEKCQRCWKVLPEVGQGKTLDLCLRCDDVVHSIRGA
ncbi:isoleucine--tRNA ligase [Candidatus Nucleicultrix amoebiphila]|uniref:Isoleucine--tRNA ligase n=1 Tax=Candidatus Nucleicultrix amoebiphila FS5 TaxID=1414854 RepID=A0A1W6N4B8_9PROT|nr:isoleucine--tRNA ligase [Candidatus Nucleicultrix amoebiphila]ARN84737.1 isoleucine--tRNA ligase [Candidatus Nucleicultrix amoebiphila FS5]